MSIRYKTTKHSGEERQDRILKIATSIGFGETIICENYQDFNDTFIRLMDNGLIIVVNAQDPRIVVTMYIPTIAQLKKYFYRETKIPSKLFNQVSKYEKKGYTNW